MGDTKEPVNARQLLATQLVRVEGDGPGLDVHHVAGLLGLEQLDHLALSDN